MTVAYLGLGSNLGDRLAYLRAAVKALATDNVVTVMARSPVFETAAVVDCWVASSCTRPKRWS